MSVEQTVKPIMDSYGIPVEVWKPIMLKESSGNPAARAITSHEHSIGLFQINVVANPGYLGQNLTDPEVNATIAARDFILPAYTKAKDMFPGDLESQAVYTYRYGIRPEWTESVESVFRGYFQEVSSTMAGGEGSSLPLSPGLPDGDLSQPVKLGFWEDKGAKILTGVGLLLVLVVGFVAMLQLFPNIQEQVTKTVKAVATKKVSG